MSARSLETVLSVENLTVTFRGERGTLRAVDGMTFSLDEGEILGLVGESGSGKSATCLAAMGLYAGDRRVAIAGSIGFAGKNLIALNESAWRRLRGRRLAMIFQDPMTSLNPFLTIGRQIAEVLEVHESMGRSSAWAAAVRALGDAGIVDPDRRAKDYPHQFSGGMRQRAMIAMALIARPDILFADEPTTALDRATEAQILELIKNLCRERGTAVVFITHDLLVAREISDTIGVLYAGRLAEVGAAKSLFADPMHPYTQGLLASVPKVNGPKLRRFSTIPGRPPEPTERPAGCAFSPRCERAEASCSADVPSLTDLADRQIACPIAVRSRT